MAFRLRFGWNWAYGYMGNMLAMLAASSAHKCGYECGCECKAELQDVDILGLGDG